MNPFRSKVCKKPFRKWPLYSTSGKIMKMEESEASSLTFKHFECAFYKQREGLKGGKGKERK